MAFSVSSDDDLILEDSIETFTRENAPAKDVHMGTGGLTAASSSTATASSTTLLGSQRAQEQLNSSTFSSLPDSNSNANANSNSNSNSDSGSDSTKPQFEYSVTSKEVTKGKVLLVTIGSRGDVQPFLALGGGLSERGYTVAVATHEIFREVVVAAGFEFYGLRGNPAKTLMSDEFRQAFYGGSMREQMEVLMSAMDGYLDENYGRVWAAARHFEPDAMIYGITCLSEVAAVGQRLGVPVYAAATIPFRQSGELPPVAATESPFRMRWVNKLAHWAAGKIVFMKLGDRINAFRRTVLGLPETDGVHQSGLPQACLFSEHVVTRPGDWPADEVAITGYSVLPLGVYTPPDELGAFLESGSPPVYFGFGSMPLLDVAETVATFSSVLRKLNMRGIFATGWGGEPDDSLLRSGDHVLVVQGAPHEWLLPRCSMAVIHGGAGTTAAALRAGIPACIFAVLGDQPFWAWRCAQLGVGPPRPVSVKQLSAGTLEAAIVAASHPDMAAAAQALGERLRAEDGVASFVDWLESRLAVERNRSGISCEWRDDRDHAECISCTAPFTLLNRRHHCRSCGQIHCRACLVRARIPAWPGSQYACSPCVLARSLRVVQGNVSTANRQHEEEQEEQEQEQEEGKQNDDDDDDDDNNDLFVNNEFDNNEQKNDDDDLLVVDIY
jgi:sterol 3beta-glucosyltransferase